VIDRIANTAQDREIHCVLSNSFGFGGTNASVIFRAAD
jgi:3-oxoacyl-[acyl-carrier-protein] synthase II